MDIGISNPTNYHLSAEPLLQERPIFLDQLHHSGSYCSEPQNTDLH
jgi:hypothetical protein